MLEGDHMKNVFSQPKELAHLRYAPGASQTKVIVEDTQGRYSFAFVSDGAGGIGINHDETYPWDKDSTLSEPSFRSALVMAASMMHINGEKMDENKILQTLFSLQNKDR